MCRGGSEGRAAAVIILGLTGSIGMGKTTAADAFQRLGVPVFDADQEVHRLLVRGGAAVTDVEAVFPGVVADSAVDRGALGRRVFGDTDALKRLEEILHPRVRASRARFLRAARARGESLVVLDIPLLFETGGETQCDYTCVVSAPEFVQANRVLRRPGMTPEKFSGVLSRQMPDAEKRRRADFVVRTGIGKRYSLQHIKRIVTMLRKRVEGGRAPSPNRCR
jgi:dephospho-CoA kinase